MKKKVLLFGLAGALAMGFYACDVIEDAAGGILSGGGDGSGEKPLSEAEVIQGLKEALTVGTNNSAGLASKLDGFNKNERIKLPFPPDAQKVKDKALKLGMDKQVEEFELTLNRAAEEACKEAAPIFVSAVKGMTVQDAWGILKGEDNAATNYLQNKTTAQLKQTFSPKVDKAIETVKLTKYWEPLAKKYNQAMTLTGGEKVNTDLTEYVTDRAVSGLFVLIADEEKKIRKDPIARVNDILKRVFGSLD